MNENAKTAAGMSSVNMDKSTDGMNPAAGNDRNDMWTDGVMGVLIGDALGNPVQFMSRSSVLKRGPVTFEKMEALRSLEQSRRIHAFWKSL